MASKAKANFALVALAVAGGGMTFKYIAKALRAGDDVVAVGARNLNDVASVSKVADEATVAKYATEGAGASALADMHAAQKANAWLTEASWMDVRKEALKNAGAEGAAHSLETLANDADTLLSAGSTSNPMLAFVPTSQDNKDLEETGRSVLAAPESLQVMLNARANPLVLGAVGGGGSFTAPDGSEVSTKGIHLLCMRSRITCIFVLAPTREELVSVNAQYEALLYQRPGHEVREWTSMLASQVAETALTLDITPYAQDAPVDAIAELERQLEAQDEIRANTSGFDRADTSELIVEKQPTASDELGSEEVDSEALDSKTPANKKSDVGALFGDGPTDNPLEADPAEF